MCKTLKTNLITIVQYILHPLFLKGGHVHSNEANNPVSRGEQCCRDNNVPEECFPLCEKSGGLTSRQGMKTCSVLWDVIVSCRKLGTTPKPGTHYVSYQDV